MSTSVASEPPRETSSMAPVRPPTFPAYSAPVSKSESPAPTTASAVSAPTPVRKIEFAANSTSKLVHPDDDISLVI